MKRAKIVALSMILLFVVLTTVASAAEMWPGWWKHNPKGGHDQNSQGYSTPEPAAIALLGAGLVSLGLYAKRKRGKKQ